MWLVPLVPASFQGLPPGRARLLARVAVARHLVGLFLEAWQIAASQEGSEPYNLFFLVKKLSDYRSGSRRECGTWWACAGTWQGPG